MGALFQHGDIVVRRNKRDERGTVLGSAQTLAARNFYRVLFPSSANPVQVPESDLEGITFDKSLQDRLLNREFGDKSTLSRLLTYERLRHPLQDNLYSLRATRTEFQAYQFKPLLKFLRSAKQRLLLADEVGLGKTIEAGFILCEMLARHPHSFRRALIVCKASLCIKWQMEMRKRFDLRFDIWRAEQLRDFLRRYLLAVSQMTDDVSQRRKREQIFRGILGSLFAQKDSQRIFTPEQRRILWSSSANRVCKTCGCKLTWEDFTIDHINPHSKGGRSLLNNAALMCRKHNSQKGNRRR